MARAQVLREPGVIGARVGAVRPQQVGDRLGLAAGAAIDDAAFARVLAHEIQDLVGAGGLGADAKAQVRPVEAVHEHGRIAPEQLADDVGAGGGIGGGGEGDGLHAAERGLGCAEPQIVRPEGVPPLRDAMGLVDREEPDAGALEAGRAYRAGPAARARHRRGAARRRRARSAIRAFSSGALAELRLAAATPRWRSWATWLRMRAISGDTTTVRPSRSSAGSW